MSKMRCGDLTIRYHPDAPNSRMGEWREAGTVIEGHDHNFHHATFIFGKAKVERRRAAFSADGTPALDKDGNQLLLDAGTIVVENWMVNIEAGMWHRITGLTRWRHACVFVPRDPETGEPVPDYNGWPDASE